MSRLSIGVRGIVAGALLVAASEAIAISGCTFKSAGGMQLAFNLDPSVPSDVVATATPFSLGADQWGSCTVSGVQMYLNVVGTLAMSNGNGATIPYSLTLPTSVPGPTGNNYVRYTLTGTVQWVDFANKPAGTNYISNVQIHVNP